jgi:hypothetical protein
MSRKLLGEFDNHYMIQHEDGSSFPVAKRGLSDELHAKIKSLPSDVKSPLKLSGGTPDGPLTADDAASAQASVPINLANPMMNAIPGATLPTSDVNQPQPTGIASMLSPSVGSEKMFGTDQAAPVTPSTDPVQITVPQMTPQNVAPEVPAPVLPNKVEGPVPPPKIADPFASVPGYKEMVAGYQGQAAAQAAANKQNQVVQDDLIKQSNELHASAQTNLSNLDQKVQQVSNDVLNGKIDPNRVWTNMSTGNKVLASIAVLIGGIGSGLTGKSNAALDSIDKSIEQDIDAQKANLGNKNNLLSHYMQQYHNIEQAENATRIHLNAVAGAQLSKIASQSGSATAQNSAQMAIGQMKQNLYPALQRQAWLTTLAGKPITPDVASHAIEMVVPKEQQAKAYQELDRVSYGMKEKDAIMTAFDQANTENTLLGRAGKLGATPASVARLKTSIMPLLKDNEGRVNHDELDRTDDLIPQPGDGPDKIATKRQAYMDFINEKSGSSLLKGFNINLNPGVYNDRGTKRFNEGAAQ